MKKNFLFKVLVCTAMLSNQVFAADLTFTNKEIDGKKVWKPEAATIKSNEKTTIKLVNTLDAVHGFEIPGLTEQVPVPGNKTITIEVDKPKPGEYKFKCHMHPAHVGGKITVE